jgi:two-component system OmpR family sensor kinase
MKQLSSLRKAAKAFGSGKLDQRITSNSISYIRDIEIKLQIKLSEDVDEMTSLVESMLNYARLDQHTLILNRQPIELFLLIEQCIKKKQSDKVKISVKCTAQYTVTVADRSYLKTVLNNILQNVINYGEGIVNVTLDEDHSLVIIHVSDNGKGGGQKIYATKSSNPLYMEQN